MTTEVALKQILQENDLAILDDHNRLRAWLKDLAPTEKAKNLVLVTCFVFGFNLE